MISTYDFETFWSFHPHFCPIFIPFVVLTHVESVVCLTKKDIQ